MDEEVVREEIASEPASAEELTTEQIADAIVLKLGGTKIGLYSERQLARKIRDESARLPLVAEADCPTAVSEYLFERLVADVLRASGLTQLERAICSLLLSGFTHAEAARRLGISAQRLGYLLMRVRAAIQARPRYDPYFGLYEVYWQEVNRYIYRKPRLEWG